MDETRALLALQALAQETRLAIFRLLVAAGPSGLPAGAIAERLEVPPSTLSFHLKELDRASLVRSWRRSRQIFYTAEFETMRRLLSFLTEECCGGHPEICGGLAQLVEQASSRAASCAVNPKPGERCRG
jgi:DNA-binding transcriptional ArsR family regulator